MVGLAGMLRERSRALPVGLGLLLVLEQLNTGNMALLDRMEEKRRLAALPLPPAECHAFAAMVSREGNHASTSEILNMYSHNVDAMLVAEVVDLPTINGISTFNPPDWNFNNVSRLDYPLRVDAYVDQHKIEGLCGLDLAALVWDLMSPEVDPLVPPTPLATTIEVGSGKEGPLVLGSNWWGLESWGIWGHPRATLWIMPPAIATESFQLTILARAFPYHPNPSQRVSVFADGKLVTVWDVPSSPGEFSAVVPRSKNQAVKVEFVVEKPASPELLGLSADNRMLGLGLSELRLDPL